MNKEHLEKNNTASRYLKSPKVLQLHLTTRHHEAEPPNQVPLKFLTHMRINKITYCVKLVGLAVIRYASIVTGTEYKHSQQ